MLVLVRQLSFYSCWMFELHAPSLNDCAGSEQCDILGELSQLRQCGLPQLHLLLGPPILAQTSRVASAQGGIDQRSIDGTDETMDSKASFTAVRAGD